MNEALDKVSLYRRHEHSKLLGTFVTTETIREYRETLRVGDLVGFYLVPEMGDNYRVPSLKPNYWGTTKKLGEITGVYPNGVSVELHFDHDKSEKPRTAFFPYKDLLACEMEDERLVFRRK